MPNQIRLTVLGPHGGLGEHGAGECDVLVTAPHGTVLAAVIGGLVTAAAATAGAPPGAGDTVAVYAGAERLDPQRHVLGEPPLVDGAMLSLYGPSGLPAVPPPGGLRLHVAAGPDAGGVHLLHGGQVRIGRSAQADVVLDDPDVSRLHCAITVTETGAVAVTDLGSTNGTTVDGTPVLDRPAPLHHGATLRLGETVLRLRAEPGATPQGGAPVPGTVPGERGHPGGGDTDGSRRPTPLRGTAAPFAPEEPAEGEYGFAEPGTRHGRGGITGWARRFAGKRPDTGRTERTDRSAGSADPARSAQSAEELPPAAYAPDTGRWPDPAEVLLTALGPGPRLWERGIGHPDALTVRLGTAHHSARPDAPVTVDLRQAGSLGLAGPRARLLSLARSVLAQLAVLHPPSALEIVLLAPGAPHGTEEWSWLGWLPQLRPARGQDCRLLLAFDRDQATARVQELVRRLDEGPTGQATVLVVDGDPGSASLREAVARLTMNGAAAGVHALCLAETPAATPSSPLTQTLTAACSASPAFRECGSIALLSGAVATAVRVVHRDGPPTGELATVDGVSAAWTQRFARALAAQPESEPTGDAATAARPATALPPSSRLLDELGLARATPAALLSRWAAADQCTGSASLVFGAGSRGPVSADLAADRCHLLISGATGSGKTELLCSLAASLAAGERPDRLGLILVDGGGEGLRACGELPHVSTYLAPGDPVRMREFAQALTGELKRRAELLGARSYEAYIQERAQGAAAAVSATAAAAHQDGDRGTLRLRAREGRPAPAAPEESALPRLAVLVDDFDALVDPALGDPGRPSAGSVVRALEAVARDGVRLGVHLIAATGRPDRTAPTVADQGAAMRVSIGGDPESAEAQPGRGVLHRPDGSVAPFQGARVTGRIPRTSTLRPTVVPLDWARAGDPPSRRPIRELGNGPTDLALLASAAERAARA